MKSLEDMSVNELKETQAQWYKWGQDTEYISKTCFVCRELGESLPAKYTPKYKLEKEGLEIYVDDYGHYATATYHCRTVMSTHPCTKLFIPGKWLKIVRRLYPFALQSQGNRVACQEESKRLDLLTRLKV